MNKAYRKKNFNVYYNGDEYIIHNINKPFKDGHTHIKNYKTCVWLIDLSINRSIPHHLNRYFLISLQRLSEDEEYTRKLQELIMVKNDKSKIKFYNKPKHFKKK